ncbi:Leukotriene A-4 hydrolase-like protein [Zea mays]|uniref:Leukotriene A-4 hydrolase-like protein n=1 Tax=Zea mays TaxID=4577 RepID=A0A1D6FVX7_MAIZE|nr:Leukotriene A-4 hydrolase-like protein [Zea mays]
MALLVVRSHKGKVMGYTSPFFLLAFTTQFQLTRKIEGQLIFILSGGCNQNQDASACVTGFEIDYSHWVDEQKRHMAELTSTLQGQQTSELELRLLVETWLSNYERLFRIKATAANADVFYVMSGLWKTPAKRFFLWIGGFRPSDVLKDVALSRGGSPGVMTWGWVWELFSNLGVLGFGSASHFVFNEKKQTTNYSEGSSRPPLLGGSPPRNQPSQRQAGERTSGAAGPSMNKMEKAPGEAFGRRNPSGPMNQTDSYAQQPHETVSMSLKKITCVKWCSESERDAIFDVLQPHLLTLSCKKYAIFLVKKLIELVVDYAFQRGTQRQKRQLLVELYSPELQLFKDLTVQSSSCLIDTISKLGLQISSVLLHMTIVIDKILEKGTVEYLIVHTAILDYFTIADKTSASDAICQLIPLLTQGALIIDGDEPTNAPELPKKAKAKKKRSKEPLIVRIMQTREGLKLGISCLKYGSAKMIAKIVVVCNDAIIGHSEHQYVATGMPTKAALKGAVIVKLFFYCEIIFHVALEQEMYICKRDGNGGGLARDGGGATAVPQDSEGFRQPDMHHGMEVRLGLSKGPICPSFS